MSTRRTAGLFTRLLFCAATIASAPVHAGPVGTLFSGATAANEMAPYWNPAAMTLMSGTHALLHASIGATRVTYQRDTPSAFDGLMYPEANFNLASPDWNLGIVTDFGLKDWRFGFSVGLPWADGGGWSLTYEGRPASTRYHGLSPVIGQLLIGPAVAYRINRYIAIGAGLDIAVLLLKHDYLVDFAPKVNQVICRQTGAGASCPLNAPLAREDPLYGGRVRIDSVGWGVGASGGVLITPTRWLRLGFGIHSNAGDIEAPATISVEVPPAVVQFTQSALPGVIPTRLGAQGDLIYGTPLIITAGIGALLLQDRLDLGLELHWMDLSTTTVAYGVIHESDTALIDDITTVRGRTDQYRIALRGSYPLLDELVFGMRFEFVTHTRPEAFMTPTSVDVHRLDLSLGLVWRLVEWMDLIVEYSHFFTWNRDVRVSRFGPKAFPVTPEEQGLDNTSPTGRYEVAGDRAGLGLAFHF